MRTIIIALLLLTAATANAQSARIIQLPSGKYIGFFHLPNGDVVYLDDVDVKKLPDVMAPVSKASVVAFVMDNDSPDIRWQGTAQLAIRELRKTMDAVVLIDDTPQSIGTLKQAAAIKKALDKVGVPAIVLIDDKGELVKAVKMPHTQAAMIAAVKP